MDYRVVKAKNLDDLQEYVLKLMRIGFEPQGGVAIGDSDGAFTRGTVYLQAMVKKEG